MSPRRTADEAIREFRQKWHEFNELLPGPARRRQLAKPKQKPEPKKRGHKLHRHYQLVCDEADRQCREGDDPKAVALHAWAKQKFGKRSPGFSTISRWLRDWKEKPRS